MKKKQKTNMLAGGVTLAFGVLLLVLTQTMNAPQKAGLVGADFLPRILAILIIALSIALMVISYGAYKKAPEEEKKEGEKTNYKGIFMTMALLLAYVVLMDILGFTLTTMVYLFLQMIFLDRKPAKKQLIIYAVIAIAAPLIINYVFVEGFQLLLPEGILG